MAVAGAEMAVDTPLPPAETLVQAAREHRPHVMPALVVEGLMDGLTCPKCRAEVQTLPKRGERDDFKCWSCLLAFSVAASDWPAINAGAYTFLSPPDAANGRIWLRPALPALI